MKLVDRLHRKMERAKRFFDLYVNGLNRKEIEQLLKKDTLEAYSYFKNRTQIKDQSARRPTIKTILFVSKEIFISFIMQLTPARRFFYGICILVFLLGLMNKSPFHIIGSFVILNGLLAVELVDKLTTRDELEIARKIQLGLQPENIPETKLLSIATYYKPARLVGGDFFDVIQPNDHSIISIVGDVSDKGISAALYAAYAQSMFQAFSETSVSPSAIFKNLNNLISKKLRDGDFITAVIAFFDLNERSVTIARAGHNWPLYYSSDTQNINVLKPGGMSIGLCENELFSSQMEEQKFPLKQGDMLLLYSDGVTEATNPQNIMFELSGLEKVLKESAHESSEMIIGKINSNLQEFVKSDDLQDDATMVAVKVK